MIRLFLTVAIATLSLSIYAQQDYQAEVGFKYVKAEYLSKTERFDEAIKELNDIIKDNPTYQNALLLRGELKYKLAAFKGAKIDAMQSIELKGITKEAAVLLGRSEYAMTNMDLAEKSLYCAVALGSIDEKVLLELADIYQKANNTDGACKLWQIATKNGSSTASINMSKFCGAVTPPVVTKPDPVIPATPKDSARTTPVAVNPTDTKPIVAPTTPSVDSTNSTASTSAGTPTTNAIGRPMPTEDNTPHDIEIDEDLTISILGQGLGKRKILDKPSILILSEKDGIVAVEICVNDNGRVETAEFNAAKSTIENKGLVSLAIRKSKEFWFEKNDFLKQCGVILYKVKGS